MALADDLYVAIRVTAVATSNVTIATALNPGDTLNGRTLVAGDLVGLVAQTAPAENGIYRAGTVPARDPNFNSIIAGGLLGPEGAYDKHPGLILVEEQTGVIYQCTSVRGGTLDTTALTFTRLYASAEDIQDVAGAMFSGNTEVGVTATYQDSDGTIDLAVDDEYVQDLVGAMVSGNTETSGISVTYDDTNGKLDFTLNGANLKTTMGLTTTSTDNAVVRFDGTTGNTQNSGVTVDDSDILKMAKISGTSMVVADDAVGTFTIPGGTKRCILIIVGGTDALGGIFWIRTDVALSAIRSAGATMAVSTGIKTGTTGADGSVYVSPHTDGNVYIENRSGASYSMHYSLYGTP